MTVATLPFPATLAIDASITDHVVTWATHLINDLGLPGVALLVAADAVGIPIAAAAILLFAGFNVSDPQSSHHFTVVGIVIAGVIGDLVGSTISFTIGWYGRRELIETHGGKLHISAGRLALVERWFERYGLAVIPIGRFIPLVRTFIGYPAGAARMPYPRFIALTAFGAIAFSIVFASIGKAVGHNWTKWRHDLGYVDYVVIALVVIALGYWFFVHRRREGDVRPPDDDAPVVDGVA